MKVTLYMAQTPNGIIARPSGSEDFLSHTHWKGFCDLARKARCVIWGRKTYEAVKGWGPRYFQDLAGVEIIIVSRKGSMVKRKGVSFALSPKKALSLAGEMGFKNAVLAGGSNLNSSFAEAGLIDEIVLSIEPILIGRGIATFAAGKFALKLRLESVNRLPKGIVQMTYSVNRIKG